MVLRFLIRVNLACISIQDAVQTGDGTYVGALVSGNEIGIAGPDDASKTGYILEQCNRDDCGGRLNLPR